jgi:phytoene dehydrogenase-like protein
MPIKHSTSALTAEDHARQDACYAQNHTYDYVIVGTGSSALTVGALLAHAGKKVCMLEAHDIPGGYAQSFKMGDYYFCAQVHYTWGCGPGGKIYEFLKKIGLENDITFELYDPEGYDHMVMPDGKMVKIPYGFDLLVENIEKAYPGQGAPTKRFCDIMARIRTELSSFPFGKIRWWQYITDAYRFRTLIRYKNKTLQDVFDECGLSMEAQAVLIANAGDMMSPPEELSVFAYVGLFGGYNTGAYYPTKHFRYYVDRLAKFITDHEGCHIYYETPVTKVETDGDQVTQVQTKDGKIFKAKQYICNMDPQLAAEKIFGWDKFPVSFQKPLKYKYSPSGMVVYLGLKDIDLRKYGFGKHNVWHLEQWDMNKIWKEQLAGDFSKPWFFISTPSLHTNEPGTTPPGGQIMEIATLTDYESFKKAQDRGYAEYAKMKMALADRLLDLVEKHYVPDLRKHIAVKVVGTTVTNEDFVMAPKGNAYGSLMDPAQISTDRLRADTPWKNFFWCNASSGYAGVYGTVGTGMALYMQLTGDNFYRSAEGPTDEEFINAIRAKLK